MSTFDIVTILGPTASGKTRIAALLAHKMNGEIISADSRQVYKHMNLGTGKDYNDYLVEGKTIPCHLIDLVEPGTIYNVYEYQKAFLEVYSHLLKNNKLPVLCGGTGLYIEAALKGYKLIEVPINQTLRDELEKMSMEEITIRLKNYKTLHNTSDISTRKHAMRAIEIETHYLNHVPSEFSYPSIKPLYVGIKYERETERKRITQRLNERIDQGMIDEVRNLLDKGLNPEQLVFYGLEYKYLTWYAIGKMSYEEMFTKLNTAIHQFAKRQMTWFRRMERNGTSIHWLQGESPEEEKLYAIEKLMAE
jgi:tRNA dimethylallyltransferase